MIRLTSRVFAIILLIGHYTVLGRQPFAGVCLCRAKADFP